MKKKSIAVFTAAILFLSLFVITPAASESAPDYLVTGWEQIYILDDNVMMFTSGDGTNYHYIVNFDHYTFKVRYNEEGQLRQDDDNPYTMYFFANMNLAGNRFTGGYIIVLYNGYTLRFEPQAAVAAVRTMKLVSVNGWELTEQTVKIHKQSNYLLFKYTNFYGQEYLYLHNFDYNTFKVRFNSNGYLEQDDYNPYTMIYVAEMDAGGNNFIGGNVIILTDGAPMMPFSLPQGLTAGDTLIHYPV